MGGIRNGGSISTGATAPTYQNWLTTPFFASNVTTQTAGDAFKRVLSDVGCNQPLLDDHDIRMVTDTLTATSTYTATLPGQHGLPSQGHHQR